MMIPSSMAPSTNNLLEKPCEVCGSVSRTETMKTCLKCEAQQHAYCTRTLNFNLSEDWLCEACQANNPELPSSSLQEAYVPDPPGHENSRSFRASGTAPRDMISANKTGVQNDLHGQQAYRKRYISSPPKIKVILPEEVMKLESRARHEAKVHLAMSSPCRKPMPLGQSSQFTKSTNLKLPWKGQVDPRGRPPKFDLTSRSGSPRSSLLHDRKGTAALTESKGPKGLDGAKSSQPTKEANICCVKIANNKKEAQGIYAAKRKRAFRTFPENQLPANKRAPSQQLKKHIGRKQQKEPLLAIEMEFSSPDMVKALRWALSLPSVSKYSPDFKSGWPLSSVEEWGNSLGSAAVLTVLPDIRHCIPYFPALDAIWMGRFILPDIDCFREHHGVFRACPPSKVHRKLYKQARIMPKNLQLELVPRCKVWSKLFQERCPNLLDVGLYFYPANLIKRSILNSYHLLERMDSQDVLLRCYFNGAELFILTSKQLQVDPLILRMGLENEHFLWGVFHESNKLPHSDISASRHSVDGHPANNNNLMDMDVDMVGRNEVDLLRKSSTDAQRSCEAVAYGGKTSPQAEPMKNHQEQAVDMVTDPAADCSKLLQLAIVPSKELISMEKHEKFIGSEEVKWPSLHNEISLQRDKLSARIPSPPSPKPIKVSTEAQSGLPNNPFCTEHSANLPCNVDTPKNFSAFSSSIVAVPEENLGPTGVNVEGQDFEPEKAEPIAVSMCNQALSKVKVEVQDSTSEKVDCARECLQLAHNSGIQNGCTPELVNFVKLSTCSVSKGDLGPSGAGGIVRDSSGKWIFGYVRNLGVCNDLRAELWAIFEGLMLLWNRGFRKVFVECESYPACESLKRAPAVDNPNGDILEGCIKLLLRKDWMCHVKHMSKGSIQASWLANHFENGDPAQCIIFENPPQELVRTVKVIDGT